MVQALTVIISGCHAGPNPSPGLGIARSLREAFPEARLIARDVSPNASGLHDPVFDEVWLAPAWEGVDLTLLRDQLDARLESAWLISGLDVEIRWLAARPHPRVLHPGVSALEQVAKPAMPAHVTLPFLLPEWKSLGEDDRALEAFCLRHDWRVWLKGPAHEARAVSSWLELREVRAELEATWGAAGLFLQQHVHHEEVSLACAAWHGELLDAVWLEKLAQTGEGKVWSGHVEPLQAALRGPLAETLRGLDWTGGGELEFVRDKGGDLWLIDWNPRFPAWIHGATLAGHNLPAALLSGATQAEPRQSEAKAHTFTRIVTEVPWRSGLPIARTVPPEEFTRATGKHPSGMPRLHRRLHDAEHHPDTAPQEALPPDLAADLAEAAKSVTTTPVRVLLPRVAAARLGLAASLGKQHSIEVAYSAKTNPDSRLMRRALEHGLLAEVISEDELAWARRCGWTPGRIIYNGPVPLTARRSGVPLLHAAFADDLRVLESYLATPSAELVGVRLRHPDVTSRFGVPLEDPTEFARLVEILSAAPAQQRLGVSFHLPSSEVGLRRWTACARDLINWAGLLAGLSGRSIATLDLGGGWAPGDFDSAASGSIPKLARLAPDILGPQVQVLIEPGKALAQPTMALLTRVVHIRQGLEGLREVVLDAGIADVPLVHEFTHRFVSLREAGPTILGRGRDTLLGPTCMERDRLAGDLAVPHDLRVGQLLAICDCGAYDASLAAEFGRGGAP
jgi:diaminopimelate decarboxylase